VRFPITRFLLALVVGLASGLVVAQADPPADPAAIKHGDDGYWRDKNGDPTYKIDKDGTVDYATFNGFRRFNSTCYVCHGPDGSGSSFAPALADSLKAMDYSTFAGVVVNGRKDFLNGKDNVMPSFADNKNVTCYLNDIYVYLRARSTGAQGRGRPPKHGPKATEYGANEDKCMADD
jgi:methanol metabolism-related c-type cytochrome